MNRVLPVLAALFIIGAGWAWLRSSPGSGGPSPALPPAVDPVPAAAPPALARPEPARSSGPAAGAAGQEAPVQAGVEPGAAVDEDEPVAMRAPKETDAPDPLRDPVAFEERLKATGDPLLPEVERVLTARGIPSSAEVRSAAWAVARNWSVFQRAEEYANAQVKDETLRAALSAERRKILVDAPRAALAKAAGREVDPATWADLEAAGARNPPPARPPRAPRMAKPLIPIEPGTGQDPTP